VARLALKAGVTGAARGDVWTPTECNRRVGVMPTIARIGVRVGAAGSTSPVTRGLEEDRFVLRSVTDELMYELMSLSGQEYVDVYASNAKKKLNPPGPHDRAA